MSWLFANPLMLLALLAIPIPPIIEWLFRRRKRRVELPTLRYLLGNLEQKKVRRQDRLLLIVRMAAIALVALALARPMLRRGHEAGQDARSVIVVLDATASMQQQVDVTTAFGLAQKRAGALLRALPPSARVTVLSVGDRVETVAEGAADRHTAAAAIDALRPSGGACPMAEALGFLRKRLEAPPTGPLADAARAEVYVLSDFQKSTWLGRSASEAGGHLAELARRQELYLVDVGGDVSFNYLMTDLHPAEYAISAHMPVEFVATVQATGQAPPDARPNVTLLVNGEKKTVQPATLVQGAGRLKFELTFPAAGEYLVEAVVDGDRHLADNRRLYLASVPEDIQVLVLDDSCDEPLPEGLFLTRAMSPPSRPGWAKVSRFLAKSAPAARLAYENPGDYRAVLLLGTPNLTPEQVSTLERYVEGGGALWVFLSDRVNLYQYNKLLHKDGAGLLPCRLLETASAPASQSASQPANLVLDYGRSEHPALAAFAGQIGSAAGSINCVVPIEPAAANGPFGGDRPARVVARYNNDAPALVERSYGRGKVLLLNFSPGGTTNNWPACPEFAIFLQDMLRYLAGDGDRAVNLRVGEAFVHPVFVSAQHLLLRTPGGQRVRLTPQAVAGGEGSWSLRFDQTRQAGVYEVDALPEVLPRRKFVVNSGPEEGDLARLTESDFAGVFGHSGWRWVDRRVALEEMASRAHEVSELSAGILWTLAAILAVESFLAVWFGRRRGVAA